MKKLCAGLIVVMMLLPISAVADPKVELSEKLISLMNMDKMMEQTKQQVLQMTSQMMNQFSVPEDQHESAAEFQKKVMEKTFEIMSFDNLHRENAGLFAEVFTLEELKGLVAFYESSVGKSLVKKQPVLMQKAMQLSQRKMAVLIPELEKMAKAFEASLEE